MAHPFRHGGQVNDLAQPHSPLTVHTAKSNNDGSGDEDSDMRVHRLRVDGRLLEITIREIGPAGLLARARRAIEAI